MGKHSISSVRPRETWIINNEWSQYCLMQSEIPHTSEVQVTWEVKIDEFHERTIDLCGHCRRPPGNLIPLPLPDRPIDPMSPLQPQSMGIWFHNYYNIRWTGIIVVMSGRGWSYNLMNQFSLVCPSIIDRISPALSSRTREAETNWTANTTHRRQTRRRILSGCSIE